MIKSQGASVRRHLNTSVFLGLLVLLIGPPSVQAQWTTNGNNINNTNSGNVGVGTTTPNRAKLEISKDSGFNSAGGIEINAAGVDTGLALGADATNNIGWIQSLEPGVSFTTRPLTLQPNGGNVGIGTTAPVGRFHVVTSSYTDTPIPTWDNHFFIVGADSNAGALSLTYNQTTNTGYLMSLSPNVAWRNTVINPFAGNVGIGTTTPLALLDVRNNDGLFYAGFGYGANKETFLRAGNSTTGVMHIGDLNTSKTLLQENGGNVGIGTSTPDSNYKLDVVGNVRVSGNIAAKYQDVAEWVPAARALPPGTVVTLNPNQSNLVEASSKAYDTGVAGVISAQPGITLGERSENKVLVATTGRVRVKVDATNAPIRVGDLLVTSEQEGVAVKSEPIDVGGVKIHRPGTIIGKALEPLAKGQGEILVLLSLQ